MISVQEPIPLKIGFVDAGHYKKSIRWQYASQGTEGFTFFLLDEGIAHVETEQSRFTLDVSDGLLIEPRTQYSIQMEENGASLYWIRFTLEILDEAARYDNFFHLPDRYPAVSALHQLLYTVRRPSHPTVTPDLLTAMVLTELFHAQCTEVRTDVDLVEEICAWIRANRATRLSVTLTAKHFNYHPDYLCTQFRQKLGISLKHFIDEERLENAKQKLLSTRLPVKALASQLGWENENQFIHFFKYHENISPTQFRHLHRHESDE